MIQCREYNKDVRLPDADYILEKVEEFTKLVRNLTPRIIGLWEIILIDPVLKDCEEIGNVPEWITLTLYFTKKKLEKWCIAHPEYAVEKVSFKEQAEIILSSMKHVFATDAFKLLQDAFRGNLSELQTTMELLDRECERDIVTVADIRKRVNYQKPIYASEVLNAFLFHDRNRWNLATKLREQLGDEFAYAAMYKYSKQLLSDKSKYLKNEDVKNYVVKSVEAPAICQAYVAFASSTNYKQLDWVLVAIENRIVMKGDSLC